MRLLVLRGRPYLVAVQADRPEPAVSHQGLRHRNHSVISDRIVLSLQCRQHRKTRRGNRTPTHERKGKGKGKRVRARVRSSTAVAVGTVLLYCTVPRRPTTKHKSTPDIHRPSKHQNNKHITAEAPNGSTVAGAIYPREAAM